MTSNMRKPERILDELGLGETASDSGRGANKRWDHRRKVYLGENIRCWIESERAKVRVEVVDISPRGIGVVQVAKGEPWPIGVGEQVTIRFNRNDDVSFSATGQLRYLSPAVFLGEECLRIGIELDVTVFDSYDRFSRTLPGAHFYCQTYVRPQVSCRDPFFFMEWLLFQVNGFTPHGIDLVVSARCKTLLPHQPLDLEVFVPGHGSFHVPVKIAPFHYSSKKNRYRIFAEYLDASDAFLQAVSEYLVICNPDATPVKLRDAGFRVGNLEKAFHVSHPSFKEFTLDRGEFFASVFSIARGADFDSPDAFEPFSRRFSCKLGSHLVASFRLIFVNGIAERSELAALGHKVPERVLLEKHIEVSAFYITQVARIGDFFLPMLRHIVRVAAQAKFKYLVFQCTDQVIPVLESVGFVKLRSSIVRVNAHGDKVEMFLVALKVNQVLVNQDDILAQETWDRLYRDLNVFLNRRMPKPKFTRPVFPVAADAKKRKKRDPRAG